MRLRATITSALLLSVGLAREARAGNTEPFFYSDDAALTAGAVVASTRDSGAVWYNPAGLGGVRRTQLDLSGSAFGIQIRNVPNALVTRLPSGTMQTNLGSADVISAPHALSFVRTVSEQVSLGIGLFVTGRDIRTAENEGALTGPASASGGTAQYRQRLDTTTDLTRYHLGPAVGWAISPHVRIGAAAFLTYGSASGFAQYVLHIAASGPGGDAQAVVLAQDRTAFSYIGAQAHAGLQVDLDDHVSVGVLVRSPEVMMRTSSDAAALQTSAVATSTNPGQLAFSLTAPQQTYPLGTIIAPLHAAVGVAYRVAPRTWAGGELDVQAPYTNQGLEGATTVNARLGGRYAVSETFSVGLGLFSDRATVPSLGPSFGDERVDWYGASGGIELRTPLALAGRDASDPLILSTTLAVRYAVGVGSFRAADLDATGNDTDPPPREVDVMYHAILPYVGSTVSF